MPPDFGHEYGPRMELEERVRDYWGGRAGLTAWPQAAVVPVPTGRPMVSVLLMGATALVWCPAPLHMRLRSQTPRQLADLSQLTALFADRLNAPAGSAALSYLDAARLPDNLPKMTEVLREEPPVPGYETFRASCAAAEVAESGIPHMPVRRCWTTREQGALASLVTYNIWDATIAHLLVLTSATHRGRGLAVATAAAACGDLLTSTDLLVQWRVSRANPASASVARKLGFVTLGQQTTILLRDAAW